MTVDRQQNAVYTLEDALLRGFRYQPPQPRAYLQEVSDEVCRSWRVPPLKVVYPYKPSTLFGVWDPKAGIVRLYQHRSGGHGQHIATLLHELAHHIHDLRFDDKGEAHGPLFVAILLQLLRRYKLVTDRTFRLLAKKHRVKIRRMRQHYRGGD